MTLGGGGDGGQNMPDPWPWKISVTADGSSFDALRAALNELATDLAKATTWQEVGRICGAHGVSGQVNSSMSWRVTCTGPLDAQLAAAREEVRRIENEMAGIKGE